MAFVGPGSLKITHNVCHKQLLSPREILIVLSFTLDEMQLCDYLKPS